MLPRLRPPGTKITFWYSTINVPNYKIIKIKSESNTYNGKYQLMPGIFHYGYRLAARFSSITVQKRISPLFSITKPTNFVVFHFCCFYFIFLARNCITSDFVNPSWLAGGGNRQGIPKNVYFILSLFIFLFAFTYASLLTFLFDYIFLRLILSESHIDF